MAIFVKSFKIKGNNLSFLKLRITTFNFCIIMRWMEEVKHINTLYFFRLHVVLY